MGAKEQFCGYPRGCMPGQNRTASSRSRTNNFQSVRSAKKHHKIVKTYIAVTAKLHNSLQTTIVRARCNRVGLIRSQCELMVGLGS